MVDSRRANPDAFRRRLVGLYALTLMEREGPLHGYALSERIAQRTEGTWRPGPGSVYPSLHKLVEGGLVRSEQGHRRRMYSISPRGREVLRGIRHREGRGRRTGPDLSPLWAEVLGSGDVGEFLLGRLRRTLDSIDTHISRMPVGDDGSSWLRSAVLRELAQATASFSRKGTRPSSGRSKTGR